MGIFLFFLLPFARDVNGRTFDGWSDLISDPIDPLSSRKSSGDCGSYDVESSWKQNNKLINLKTHGCSQHEHDIEPVLLFRIFTGRSPGEDVCTINGNTAVIYMKILLRLLESKNILLFYYIIFQFLKCYYLLGQALAS